MSGEIVVFNERTEVNFDNCQVRVDGSPAGQLTPQRAAILKALVDNKPFCLSYDALEKIMNPDHKAMTVDTSRRASRQITSINETCHFKNNEVIKNVTGIGYKINLEAIIRVIRQDYLETVDTETFFKREKGYIEPVQWLNELYDDAFRNTRVHVISGERGIGKSDLAKHFAVNACRDIRYAWKPFKSVIYVTYTDDSLHRTIESLRCVGHKNEPVSYEQKISWLEKMAKPVLLIIDNYDNEESWRRELSEDSETYREILATGCHILMTSRIDLSTAYAAEQTLLEHLPIDRLIGLFGHLAENINITRDKQKISILIDQYLRNNTYLVRLAAGLMKTKQLDDIIRAFENASVGSIKELVNGRNQTRGSVMELFSLLYDMTSVEKDPEKRRLLYNLALLPIEGMEYNDFLAMAYGEPERKTFEALEDLTESFWVFLRKYRLSIHPLVKEMISRRKELFNCLDVDPYIEQLNGKISKETYALSLADDLLLAEAAYKTLSNLDASGKGMAFLTANIVSGYDLLGNKDMISRFGKRAVSALDAAASEIETSDIMPMASAYNAVGYALLHVGEDREIVELAEYAIDRSAELIEYLDHTNYKALRLYTVNQGNHAAKALTRGDYQQAYDIHSANKDLRLEMREIKDSPDICQLIGASYKGMATASYYLARRFPAKRLDYLKEAVKDHTNAVFYYEEAYGKGDHPDLAVAKIRRAGAGRALIETEGIYENCEFGKELLRSLKEAINALLKMKAINIGEVKNALNQYIALVELFKEAELLDEAIIKDCEKITRSVTAGIHESRPEIEELVVKLTPVAERGKSK